MNTNTYGEADLLAKRKRSLSETSSRDSDTESEKSAPVERPAKRIREPGQFPSAQSRSKADQHRSKVKAYSQEVEDLQAQLSRSEAETSDLELLRAALISTAAGPTVYANLPRKFNYILDMMETCSNTIAADLTTEQAPLIPGDLKKANHLGRPPLRRLFACADSNIQRKEFASALLALVLRELCLEQAIKLWQPFCLYQHIGLHQNDSAGPQFERISSFEALNERVRALTYSETYRGWRGESIELLRSRARLPEGQEGVLRDDIVGAIMDVIYNDLHQAVGTVFNTKSWSPQTKALLGPLAKQFEAVVLLKERSLAMPSEYQIARADIRAQAKDVIFMKYPRYCVWTAISEDSEEGRWEIMTDGTFVTLESVGWL